MPQVRSAACAGHLHPPHPEAVVLVRVNRLRVDRRIKTGPAAAGVELSLRRKERGVAGTAVVHAVCVIVGQHSRKGALGAFFSHDVVLFRGQKLAPLCVGFLDLFRAARLGGIGHDALLMV